MKTAKLIFSLLLLIPAPLCNASIISGFTGTLSSGVTYSIAGNITPQSDFYQTSQNNGGTAIINFSAPVDFALTPTSLVDIGIVNFDGAGLSNTFTADTGDWVFTPGTVDLTQSPFHDAISNSNVLNTFAAVSNGTLTAPLSGADWGAFSISGVTSIQWDYTDNADFEAFTFNAVETAASR